MVVRRAGVMGAVVAVLVAVTACSGADPDDDVTPRPTTSYESTSAEDALWKQSLCAGIDPIELAAVFDQSVAGRGAAGMSSVGIPSYDSCTISVGAEGDGIAATFSWSVEPVDAAAWAAIEQHARNDVGRYTELEPIDLGKGGYAYTNTAVAHLGNRAVRLTFDAPTASAGQLREALALAEPAVADLPDAPAKRALEPCTAFDAQAEAVMGAPATIRRDYVDPGTELVSCGWATPTAAVSVSASHVDEAQQQLERSIQEFSAEKIDDLGVVAGYFGGEDGRSVQLVTESGTFVQVGVPALLPGDRDDLLALAEAVAPTY